MRPTRESAVRRGILGLSGGGRFRRLLLVGLAGFFAANHDGLGAGRRGFPCCNNIWCPDDSILSYRFYQMAAAAQKCGEAKMTSR